MVRASSPFYIGGEGSKGGSIGERNRRIERICRRQGNSEQGQKKEQAVAKEYEEIRESALQRPWRQHGRCMRTDRKLEGSRADFIIG